MKVMSQSASGRVFKCPSCDKIHIEFNNLYFTFDDEEYKSFSNYFLDFDVHYWIAQPGYLHRNKKLLIPVGHRNVATLFSASEIYELKNLFIMAAQNQKQAMKAGVKFKNEILLN
jgi:hypothetical protein